MVGVGTPGDSGEGAHGHQAVTYVLMDVAMIEGRRALDGGVGPALRQARATEPLSRAGLGGQPGAVEALQKRARRHIERGGESHPLRIHGRDHAADGLRNTLSIKEKIAARVLDPTGVHQHAGRMEDGVHVGEPRL